MLKDTPWLDCCCLFLSPLAVSEFLVYTPDETNYTRAMMLTTRVQSIQFSVQACNDAMLALANVPAFSASDSYYEVLLGTAQNTKCEIRKSGQSVALAPANVEVLNCNEKRFVVHHLNDCFNG